MMRTASVTSWRTGRRRNELPAQVDRACAGVAMELVCESRIGAHDFAGDGVVTDNQHPHPRVVHYLAGLRCGHVIGEPLGVP